MLFCLRIVYCRVLYLNICLRKYFFLCCLIFVYRILLLFAFIIIIIIIISIFIIICVLFILFFFLLSGSRPVCFFGPFLQAQIWPNGSPSSCSFLVQKLPKFQQKWGSKPWPTSARLTAKHQQACLTHKTLLAGPHHNPWLVKLLYVHAPYARPYCTTSSPMGPLLPCSTYTFGCPLAFLPRSRVVPPCAPAGFPFFHASVAPALKNNSQCS